MGDSNTGTNGKKSIEEILRKDRVIRKLLDEDEMVEYISYKKGVGYKFFMAFFLIIGLVGLKDILLKRESIFDSIMLILIFYIFPLYVLIEGNVSKLVVTNKGIIIRSVIKSSIYNKALCTDKFYYSEIKEVGWSYFKFSSAHMRVKIKNKKYHSKAYPLGPNLKIKEAKLLTQMIKNKLKGVN